ncbi:MAG: hypothetical protein ACLGXA_07965, partial [Acidobacteriota bacterium]
MSTSVKLPCGHQIAEDKLLSIAARIASGRRKTPTGGAQPGAGRPAKLIDCPRGCGHRCGVAAMRKHKCP